MGTRDEHINPIVVNAVYLFKQGGPTLIAMASLVWVVYLHTTQFQQAVFVLTQTVAANTAVLQAFITKVKTDHQSQMDAIKQLKVELENDRINKIGSGRQ